MPGNMRQGCASARPLSTERRSPTPVAQSTHPGAAPSTKLTVVVSGMRDGGVVHGEFPSGLVYIVSGLKTWVETGAAMGAAPEPEAATAG